MTGEKSREARPHRHRSCIRLGKVRKAGVSARDDGIAEEERLLDLAYALCEALRSDALAVIRKPDMLADLLVNAAAHL